MIRASIFNSLVLACTSVVLAQAPASKSADGPQVIVDQASPDIFPDSWRVPKIDARAELLDDSERERCRQIAERALAKYPTEMLASTLKKVYFLGRLEYSGVATGGTRSLSAIYVVCKPRYTSADVERIIHAEYSSVLFHNHRQALDEAAWKAINPAGFSYLGGGVQAVKSGQATRRSDAVMREQGFISEYAKASIEEDFNSHVAPMMMGDPSYWEAVAKYPKLRAKSDHVIDFYAKIHASFTLAKFQSLREEPFKFANPEEFLPPAPTWNGASEALIAPPDHPWITPTEKTGMTDTPDYAETIAWLEKLAAASPLVRLITIGKTAQGRDLYAVIASLEGLDATSKLAASDKPTLLVQAGIHSGEIDGKDAGMMLLRDIAFGGKSALLTNANLLFIPVLNADGHERRSVWNRPNQRGPTHQGWRTTAQNLNLNRDYMKAQAPEMIALLKLIQESKPSLYLDIHVTDGVDYQYDITYGFHGWQGGFAWSPRIGQWLDLTLRPALDVDLAKAGHIPGPLVFAKNNRDLSQGIIAKPYDPRFSTGYGDLRHLPTLLIENHSLKPFRQRVLGTYVLIESCLRIIGEQATALQDAIAHDEASRPATLGFNWNGAPDHETTMPFLGIASETFNSTASGIDEVSWLGKPLIRDNLPVHLTTKPQLTLRRPVAYYLPVTEADMLAVLSSHGVRMETLEQPKTLKIEHYRLVDPVASAKPFEGRHTVVTRVRSESGIQQLPAGTIKVSTDQPLGDLAIALLEPEHVDSLTAWGFVPEILSRTEYIEGYVIAQLAERMMQESPQLKAEFEAKLASDPDFAKDPEARLQWFYQRSPFYDQAYLRYPVAIERD